MKKITLSLYIFTMIGGIVMLALGLWIFLVQARIP